MPVLSDLLPHPSHKAMSNLATAPRAWRDGISVHSLLSLLMNTQSL